MPLFLALALIGCSTRSPGFPGPVRSIASAAPAPVRVPAPPPAGVAETPERPPRAAERPARSSGTGDAIADAARHYLSHAPSGFRDDCSGFVMAAHARAGTPISGNTRTLWEDAETAGQIHRKRPRPGDLAYFDDTYDRNRNGKRDDPLTHVAVVIEVEPDGTVVMAHGGTSRGRSTLRMNLDRPHERTDPDGRVLNDWLRARLRGEPEGAGYLAGELFRGFSRAPDGPVTLREASGGTRHSGP